jgi:hypothetical protein
MNLKKLFRLFGIGQAAAADDDDISPAESAFRQMTRASTGPTNWAKTKGKKIKVLTTNEIQPRRKGKLN